VVDLNRAVAVAMAQGPTPALRIADQLLADGALPGSHLLPSVRGELLTRLGRDDETRAELERAVACAATSESARCCGARSTASRTTANLPAEARRGELTARPGCCP
jgi:predicted RNA polymerase sigma factor